MGDSTAQMEKLELGQSFTDVVGPLGKPSEFIHVDDEKLKNERIIFIAGGVGTAPVYPQVKWLVEKGVHVEVIIGARSKELVILEDEFKALTPYVHICTDDGSYGIKGNVTNVLEKLVSDDGKCFTHVVAIGPMIMMKFSTLMAKKLNLPIIVSLNPLMIDGTGMCGACRVEIDGRVKFACVDGPEFDGHKVNFDEAMLRLRMKSEGMALEHENENCPIEHEEVKDSKKRVAPYMLEANERVFNFSEVNLGYQNLEATCEASRCLECKKAKCVCACPVGVDIPHFVGALKNGDLREASRVLSLYTKLPSVCGRVCPQERQCEGSCVVGKKGESISIGQLERYVGDWALENVEVVKTPRNGKKVAVVGSGPAGLACSAELAFMGYDVDVFESLHKLGGVLSYGIPSFRLPKEIVSKEIENIAKMGVTFHTNFVVGKTQTVDDFLNDGYEAVFIGSGAGFPKFMGIKGESSLGVFSANEFLTRVNLMGANLTSGKTPSAIGKKVAVIGAGNVAMDAARVAKRLGCEVSIVYRRGFEEIPARHEEIEHAKEEGVEFKILTNPIEILHDDELRVRGIKCIKMELGEKDEGGRASCKEIEGSEFIIDVDSIIISIGTVPNDLVTASTKELEISKKGTICLNGGESRTSRDGVFAGGDIVTGAATVIEAMGAGKKAAVEIDEYIKSKN